MGDTEILGSHPPAPPASLREQVADEILGLLGRRRMSVAALARALGHTNQMQLSRRLNGATAFTLGEIVAIARVLRVDSATLLPTGVAHAAVPASLLNLDEIQAISAALGISPADVVARLDGTNSSSVSLAVRPTPAGRRPAATRPNGHP